jgi:chromosome segregation ATPase
MVKCPSCLHRLTDLDRQVRKIEDERDVAKMLCTELGGTVAERDGEITALKGLLADERKRQEVAHETIVDLTARLAEAECQRRELAIGLLNEALGKLIALAGPSCHPSDFPLLPAQAEPKEATR